MAGLVLDIYLMWLFKVGIGFVKRWRAKDWPAFQARLANIVLKTPGYGCPTVSIAYDYEIEGKLFKGINQVPFFLRRSAREYEKQLSRLTFISIRVNPKHPELSFAS